MPTIVLVSHSSQFVYLCTNKRRLISSSRFVPFRSVPLGVPFISFRRVSLFHLSFDLFMIPELIFFFQEQRVPLQINLLQPLLRVHGEEISGDGRFVTSYFLMATPLMHGWQSPRHFPVHLLTRASRFESARTFARESPAVA